MSIAAFDGGAWAQSFGVELHNTLMPAAGAMGGTSIAMPQDLTSAINGNPAALTQFQGTQFVFGGAWAEATFNMDQTGPIPLLSVDPFSAKSTAQGGAAGNIGATQDLSELGIPATLGLGFVTAAAGAADFRHIPESNGTNSALTVFELPLAVGVDVSDRLSLGAGIQLGIAFFDGPFVEIGGTTLDYALRGVVGTNYLVNNFTSAGFYYQTEQSFRFDHAVRFNVGPITTAQDVRMDLPQNFGFGLANNRLLNGQLLVAADVVYKLWDEADLYRAIYDNQWVFQIGTQYTLDRYRLRAGYAYAENPLDPDPESNIGGITPVGGIPAVRYTQGLMAITSRHRISGGIGVTDVLPGVDMDLMAGGMFRDTEEIGALTTTSIASYWVGTALTWRFGRGACCRTSAPDTFTTDCN
jgi:long-chain fatty acid transport protein